LLLDSPRFYRFRNQKSVSYQESEKREEIAENSEQDPLSLRSLLADIFISDWVPHPFRGFCGALCHPAPFCGMNGGFFRSKATPSLLSVDPSTLNF